MQDIGMQYPCKFILLISARSKPVHCNIGDWHYLT